MIGTAILFAGLSLAFFVAAEVAKIETELFRPRSDANEARKGQR